MVEELPKEFRAESKRLCQLWVELGDEMSMDEIVDEQASEEFREYYKKQCAHLDEMKRQGITV